MHVGKLVSAGYHRLLKSYSTAVLKKIARETRELSLAQTQEAVLVSIEAVDLRVTNRSKSEEERIQMIINFFINKRINTDFSIKLKSLLQVHSQEFGDQDTSPCLVGRNDRGGKERKEGERK